MKQPAFQRVAEKIREQFLHSGSAAVGDRLPGVQELARRYQVSVPTVSKALGVLQAEGVLETTRGAGIFITALPMARATGILPRGRRLGFIANAFAPSVAQKVLAGVTRTAALHGCRVELAMTDWDPTEERWHLLNMAKQGLDGVIVYPSVSPAGVPHYLADTLPDFPVVVIDLARPEMKRPSLVFDNWKAGLDMTRHLLDAGHENIGFISLGDSRSVSDRLKGYRRALASTDQPYREELVGDGMEALHDKNFGPLLDRLLALPSRPTAIIAPYDQFARYCLDELDARPDGAPPVEVVGFDNIQTDEWRHRFPTTGPDFYNLGERAVDMLLQIIDSHASTPTETVLPAPLILPPNALVPAEASRLSLLNTPNPIPQ
ncbi:MAG: GntR family transcriptional regulator [Chthoniobacterales bacterium]|nr:GntR family transcriptional regulator [Chthoniobacterales bacterium]